MNADEFADEVLEELCGIAALIVSAVAVAAGAAVLIFAVLTKRWWR